MRRHGASVSSRGAGRGLAGTGSCTVQMALDDWFAEGLSGRSARTIKLYRDGVAPLAEKLGRKELRKLSAADVCSALASLSVSMSSRSIQIAHNCLVRAICNAEAADLVGRNVAGLVPAPAVRSRLGRGLVGAYAQPLAPIPGGSSQERPRRPEGAVVDSAGGLSAGRAASAGNRATSVRPRPPMMLLASLTVA